jgi:ATP-dependent protease HslVU (ClpYQ) peptidase subunit
MTTIAAIQGDGWAVIGYDSLVSEESRTFILPKDSGKVGKNGPYLLGAAGDVRAINLVLHTLKPPAPTPTDRGVKLDKFISTKFVPALKACFDEAQYGEKGSQDSSVLVVVNGSIYEIGSNYEWCHDQEGIYALGSGGDYALGALYQAKEGKKRTVAHARSSVKSALEIASTLDTDTGGPLHILTQKTST